MTSDSQLLYRRLQMCSVSIEKPLDFYFRKKITPAAVWRIGAPKEAVLLGEIL